MKNSSLNEALIDLNKMIGQAKESQMTTKDKAKYYISFSNDYEIFEDVEEEVTYENSNGELLLDILNKKDAIFASIMKYISETKENVKKIDKAIIVDLFEHFSYIDKLREDLEESDVNQSIINLLCEDLNKYIGINIQEQDDFLAEYNSNRKDELDLEELLEDEEKLKLFVQLDDFNEYFEHDRSDLDGVKKEIKKNISLIDQENAKLVEHNNNLLSGILNYLYSIITFFMIVDKQVDRRTKSKENIEDLLIKPLNIPRSETNFERLPQNGRGKKSQLEGQFQIVTKYEITSLDELLNIYIRDIMENKITIRKCRDCGKFFLPTAKQIYCDGCKGNSYDVRKNTNSAKVLYRNNYKNQHNKMRRLFEKNPDIKLQFDSWNLEAKNMTIKCLEGKITLNELNLWFKDNKNLNNF